MENFMPMNIDTQQNITFNFLQMHGVPANLTGSQGYPVTSSNPTSAIQPNNPIEYMRQANANYNTIKEYQENFEELHQIWDRNMAYCNMATNSPIRLLPCLPISIPTLSTNSLFSLVSYLTHISGLQPLGCVLAILTCIAAATHGRVVINCQFDKIWKEALILRSMQSALSGSRKTLVFEMVTSSFHEYQKNMIVTAPLSKEEVMIAKDIIKRTKREYVKNFDPYASDALQKFKSMTKTITQNQLYLAVEQTDNPTEIITAEATPFALQNILSHNGGSLYYATDEGSSFYRLCDKNKLGVMAHSYDQQPETYAYGKHKNTIIAPSISMLVYSQPNITIKLYTSKKLKYLHDAGILARFLPFVHIPYSLHQEYSFPSGNMANPENYYNNLISELLQTFYTKDQNAKKFAIDLDLDAQRQLQQFVEEIAIFQRETEAQRAWLAKLAGQSVRLAGALHFWRYGKKGTEKTIRAEDYAAARDIAKTLIPHNNYLTHPLGLEAEGNAKKIQAYLRRFTAVTDQERFMQKGLTSSAISRNTGLTTLEVNNALSLLAFTNWITFHSDNSGNLVARFRPEIFVMDVA